MRKNKGLGKLCIFTDGGSRGNPGPAAVGAVLLDREGNKVAEISRYIGIATNNVAEYLAVLYSLQEAAYLGADSVVINLDSQLVARQLKGEYRVKDQNILKFFDLVLNLFREFATVKIEEIPREKNTAADGLANKALDLKALV